MIRTIIFINFIITSSLTSPLDEIKTAEDNVRLNVKIKESTELPDSTEENISRNVNIDDLINDSEMNEMYYFKSRNTYVRHLKEPEVNLAFDITDVIKDKSKSKTGKKEYLNADFQSEVKNIRESTTSSKDRPVGEIESTTAYFDISRTEDYLEGPFEGIESDKTPSEAEFEIVQFEFEAPNDESNSEWDVLDDIISTRRMSSETKVVEPKAKTIKENDDSPISAQSESLKGDKTYKLSEKENIYENVTPKSVEKENTEDDNNKNGNKENPKDDESSERTEEKKIESYENSDSVKKEHSEADNISNSIGNENVDDETSKSVKNAKAFHGDAKAGDLRPNGNITQSSPRPFENKRIEVNYNQQVPHVHPSLRFEEPRRGLPSYQIRPANPVNQKNVGNQGFKSRNIGILPLASRSQEFDSKQVLEKSMEYKENRNIDDYGYERTANAYSFTPEGFRTKSDYILSKLVEASKNSQRNKANFPVPNYGAPLNNFRRFGGISNPNLYMYPPNIRPLSTTFRSAK